MAKKLDLMVRYTFPGIVLFSISVSVAQTPEYDQELKSIYTFVQSKLLQNDQKRVYNTLLSIFPCFVDIDYSNLMRSDSLKKTIPGLPPYQRPVKEFLIRIRTNDTSISNVIGDYNAIQSDFKLFFSPPIGDYVVCELRSNIPSNNPFASKYLLVFQFSGRMMTGSFMMQWRVN